MENEIGTLEYESKLVFHDIDDVHTAGTHASTVKDAELGTY